MTTLVWKSSAVDSKVRVLKNVSHFSRASVYSFFLPVTASSAVVSAEDLVASSVALLAA